MPVRIMSFFLGLALLGATAVTGLKPINPVALQTMVDVTARELMLPGAVVLLHTPQGDFTAAYGTTQLGMTNRPGAGTYFRIASNTKTMAAAVIVQLAQEGKLKFSDPISKYVAGVPNGENITIAELLDMRSGLYNYTDSPEVAAIIDHDMSKAWTPAELLAVAFARPPNFAPDAKYEYSNTNYVLLGLVIEKSIARLWPRRCRNDCLDRSACGIRHCLQATSPHSRSRIPTDTSMEAPRSP
jgi:D-alanyl-D-alanine carboxypeptidase